MTGMMALATAIAREMGDGWKAAPAANADGAFIRHEDGRGVYMWRPPTGYAGRTGPRQFGRIEIHGEYPDGWDGPWMYWSDQPHITVSPSRPARGIAGDIRRRLLPRYEPTLEKARADTTESERLRVQREDIAARILAAVPGSSREACQPRHDYIYLRLPGFGPDSYSNRIRINRDGEVDLTMRSIDPAVAVRLAVAMGQSDGPSAMPATGRKSVRPTEAQTSLRRVVRRAIPGNGSRRPDTVGQGTGETAPGQLF